MTMERFDVVVIGSGFAGSILARILNIQGRSVLLVERGAHPRFAIGESSTPLGNFCLERLAATWDLPDLHDLASYGRWSKVFPELRRGLKRGFTFYRHETGAVYRNDTDNTNRLLVAASPGDDVADSHWLRADIDHHLVRRAAAEGVDVRERTWIGDASLDGDGLLLEAQGEGRRYDIHAALVIDGSGAGQLLARKFSIPTISAPAGFDTRLVFGHFTGVHSFAEVAAATGAELPPGPYPEERAAVHHVLDGGWMYVLPFDDGVVSAGFVVRTDRPGALDDLSRNRSPEVAWATLLESYPTLAAQFRDASPVRPIACAAGLPRRLESAIGDCWAPLPHTYAFFDPIFSTGIAWSLAGVECLAHELTAWRPGSQGAAAGLKIALERYGRRLQSEGRQLERLMEGAYLAMDDFDLLVQQSFLYFATVSFLESHHRLRMVLGEEAGGEAGELGYLGAGDPALEEVFTSAVERLRALAGGSGSVSSSDRQQFAAWIRDAIAPWNVAGLADPAARNLYPVDLDLLVDHADLLGLPPERVRQALPQLRRGLPGRSQALAP